MNIDDNLTCSLFTVLSEHEEALAEYLLGKTAKTPLIGAIIEIDSKLLNGAYLKVTKKAIKEAELVEESDLEDFNNRWRR